MTTLASFLFVLGVLVFIHELGHFLLARWNGVRVLTFSLGFGPKLLKVQRGDTEYCISAIPLGGYVKMAGENPEDPHTGADDEFMAKSKWQRFQILIAGPMMNILLAIVLLAAVLMQGADVLAYLDKPAQVGAVEPGSPAEKAGIQVGDTITLSGGTAGTAAVVTVATVSSGAVATFTITTAGSYSVTASTFTQASTSGSGTGATFKTAVWGANTFTITTAGGYTASPSASNALTAVSSSATTAPTASLAFGVGTALITHSGNYSSAPGFSVTSANGAGSGASIATGTLGGNGNAIVRAITGMWPATMTASVEINSQAGTAYILAKLAGSTSFAFVPPSTTLAAGTFDALILG